MILLLIGVAMARPTDTRDALDRIEYEDVHDPLLDNYNSSYDQAEDQLGDNTDVGAYGVAMIGIILAVLSFMKKREKVSGLLYQKGGTQNISPKELAMNITKPNQNPAPITPPPGQQAPIAPSQNECFELPEIGGTEHSPAPAATPPVDTTPAVASRKFDPMTGEALKTKVEDVQIGTMTTTTAADGSKECTLCCPNCSQNFTLKGNIQEVICPRCGKRFRTKGLKK